MKKRLAIILTHPIQYYAPFFRELGKSDDRQIKVFYTWGEGCLTKFDPGFKRKIEWDIPLLEGYEYTFVTNVSKNPGSSSFWGIQNPSLIKEISEWMPNAILIYGWRFVSHLKALMYFKGKIPIYFRGDSHLLNEKRGLKKFLRRIFLTWIYAHIDYALYVGTNNKDYYKKHGVKSDQLIYMPHVIDNDYFQGEQEEYELKAAIWRKELGIQEDELVILYAGKFYDLKNLDLLISAFKSVKGKKIKLILAGNGPQEDYLRKEANGSENIIFLPFQNQKNMPVLYRLGDIFCLPSKSETWGLSINEAMACKRPVIVSDKVGCAIDLVNRNNGWIFSSGSSRHLTEIFSVVINLNKEHIQKMGLHSLEIVRKWNFKNLIEIIKKLD